MNYFTLFDLPVEYQIDISTLTPRYQALQRQYHPDRFVTASASEQLAAVQQAATINDAYQVLKHPLKRAEYLLLLQGFDIQNEQHTMHDTAFLMEQFELREALDAISKKVTKSASEAETQLLKFSEHIDKMIKQRYQTLIQALADQQWQTAADNVRKLKFLEKLQQQIEQIEEQLFDA